MYILLVEDDPAISHIAQLALERLGGHLVDLVDNGTRALQLALQGKYDLILLDWMIPGTDGKEICKRLKESPQSHIPVVFLSARSQQQEIDSCLQLGAAGYIQKPFDPKKLCQTIEGFLGKRPAA